MLATDGLRQYPDDFNALLKQISLGEVERLVDLLEDSYRNERFVFIIGNGRSAANASHFCEDLTQGGRKIVIFS